MSSSLEEPTLVEEPSSNSLLQSSLQKIRELEFQLQVSDSSREQVLQHQRVSDERLKDIHELQDQLKIKENEIMSLRAQLSKKIEQNEETNAELEDLIEDSWFRISKYKIYSMMRIGGEDGTVLVRFDKDSHECVEMVKPPNE